MANVANALRIDLADLTRAAKTFSPPYIYQGLYSQEMRRQIEAPNRATVAAVFERRKNRQASRERLAKMKRMHDNGMHLPGRCPFCPANFYYD